MYPPFLKRFRLEVQISYVHYTIPGKDYTALTFHFDFDLKFV